MDNQTLPSVNQRIKDLINKETNGNKAKFSRVLGYSSPQKLNRLFMIDARTGKFPQPSATILKDISNAFGVRMDWLMLGKEKATAEEKPAEETESTEENRSVTLDASIMNPKVIYIPLVNQYAYGGYVYGYENDTYLDQLPRIPFIADYEGKGNYLAFEVRGDSMDDGTDESYKEGDRILCREVGRHLWAQSKLHHKKWDFVIVHEDGILLKRIIDHDVENHTITIHSLNDFYPDKVIDLAEVAQIFNVVESVRPRRR
jgi:Predicted transcriptional regulator